MYIHDLIKQTLGCLRAFCPSTGGGEVGGGKQTEIDFVNKY